LLSDATYLYRYITGWSCLGVRFRGVPWATVLSLLSEKTKTSGVASLIKQKDQWSCLFQWSADGYTAGVHRDDLDGAFLAVTDGDGAMLSEEHGGPRLVFPKCFGWKSAKFLSKVELLADDKSGFWEKLGCHARGRWALEERWAPGTSARVWNVLAWITSQYRVFGGEWVWEFVMVRGGRALGGIAGAVEAVKRWPADFATRAAAWGERDRKRRRKRRKALKNL
jgi:DMSO/TMAO reductase YedYZ molybdopterin-dependent catalytic subunit